MVNQLELKQQKEYVDRLKKEKKRIEGFLQFCRRPAQSSDLSRQLRAKQTEIERATNTLNNLYLENGGVIPAIDPN